MSHPDADKRLQDMIEARFAKENEARMSRKRAKEDGKSDADRLEEQKLK